MMGKMGSEDREGQNGYATWRPLDVLLIFVAFLALYIPFRSIDFDANGVIEAADLESGSFFSHNHIIYRVIGGAIYHVVQVVGYSGRSLYVLQALDALCGAAGVVLAFIAFLELGASRRSAFAGAFLWGTSFIYWYYSTDVAYVVMASAFAAAALLCSSILKKKVSIPAAVLMGLFLALSILTFQMACFLFPVLLWMVRRRIRELTLAVGVVAAVLGGGYLALGISEGHYTPLDLLSWAMTYAGGHLPEWGRMEIGRIPIAVSAAVRSFQFDAFANIREFLANPYRKFVWRLMFGTGCYFLFALASIAVVALQIVRGKSNLGWLVASYLIFWPFIVWFSPSESYFFLLPNLFLCGAVALAWKSPLERPLGAAFVFGMITVMAAFTFTSWVRPKHIDPGIVGRKVECIAKNVRPNDLVIAPDWYWPASLQYFHGIEPLQIIDKSVSLNNHDKLIEFMTSESRNAMQKGGRVLIVDPGSYTSEYLDWLATQTSFTSKDFDRFPGKFEFQCEDAKFRSVTFVD